MSKHREDDKKKDEGKPEGGPDELLPREDEHPPVDPPDPGNLPEPPRKPQG
jgi:hypothetical protein